MAISESEAETDREKAARAFLAEEVGKWRLLDLEGVETGGYFWPGDAVLAGPGLNEWKFAKLRKTGVGAWWGWLAAEDRRAESDRWRIVFEEPISDRPTWVEAEMPKSWDGGLVGVFAGGKLGPGLLEGETPGEEERLHWTVGYRPSRAPVWPPLGKGWYHTLDGEEVKLLGVLVRPWFGHHLPSQKTELQAAYVDREGKFLGWERVAGMAEIGDPKRMVCRTSELDDWSGFEKSLRSFSWGRGI